MDPLCLEDCLPLGHNWSTQRSSRITAKYFIKSIIQQLPWEAKSERGEGDCGVGARETEGFGGRERDEERELS